MAITQEPKFPDEGEIPPGIRRSMETYWNDLPQLLMMWFKRGKWVAYHGSKRVGFARTQWRLRELCLQKQIRSDEIFIGRIVEHEVPPWEPLDVDVTLENYLIRSEDHITGLSA